MRIYTYWLTPEAVLPLKTTDFANVKEKRYFCNDYTVGTILRRKTDVFVWLQGINVADNIIEAGDGAGDGHCSHHYFIGELITGHATSGQEPGFQVARGPHIHSSKQY
ncbi:MAG: hypothetical protein ABFS24_06935 [Pseudomonadota bacterium]